jgi:hypothetical protein
MQCWHCNTELIWNCDYDISDEYPDYSMMTFLHCPKCKEETDE